MQPLNSSSSVSSFFFFLSFSSLCFMSQHCSPFAALSGLSSLTLPPSRILHKKRPLLLEFGNVPLFLSSAPSVCVSSCLQFPVLLAILRLKHVTQKPVIVPCEFSNCPSAVSFLSSNPTSVNKSLPHHHSGLF